MSYSVCCGNIRYASGLTYEEAELWIADAECFGDSVYEIIEDEEA